MSAAESLRPEDSLWTLMAIYLRHERQKRKQSQSEVAMIIGTDKSRVTNIEGGRFNLTRSQAEALDKAWDTGGLFLSLRRYAVMLGRDREWDKQLGDFESGALVIKIYFGRVIPVPLQTEDYAGAVLLSGRVPEEMIEDAVRKRMARAKRLLGQLPGMSLWLLLDQRVLEPPDIPAEVMRGQLTQILELSGRVSVRIVPAGAQTHMGINGDFELITTSSGANVAYVWAQLGGRLIHEASEVRELALGFDRIGAKALTEDGSRQLLAQMSERLQ